MPYGSVILMEPCLVPNNIIMHKKGYCIVVERVTSPLLFYGHPLGSPDLKILFTINELYRNGNGKIKEITMLKPKGVTS